TLATIDGSTYGLQHTHKTKQTGIYIRTIRAVLKGHIGTKSISVGNRKSASTLAQSVSAISTPPKRRTLPTLLLPKSISASMLGLLLLRKLLGPLLTEALAARLAHLRAICVVRREPIGQVLVYLGRQDVDLLWRDADGTRLFHAA